MLIEVSELNELLSQGFSFRRVCQTRSLKRSTLQGQLRKAGYELINNQYVKVNDGVKEFNNDGGCTDVGTKKEPITLITLDDRIETIRKRLSSITSNFCDIACELYKIDRDKEYESRGYSSIVEFASSEFSLNRNNTYNFLRIAEQYLEITDTYYLLKDEYKGFNFSQLVEVLSVPDEVKKDITPDMSVKDIREIKKKHKDDVIEQIEGQQNFVDAEYSNVVESEAPKLSLKEERNKYRDENLQLKVSNGKFEKLVSNLNTEIRSLRTLNSELQKTIKSKIDLSMSISILEKAWSNLQDDNEANELRKQIDYIMSLC